MEANYWIVLLESSSDTPALSSDTLASGTSASSSSRANGEDMLVCGDMGLVVGRLSAISPTKRNIHFSSNTLYLVLVMFSHHGLLKERNDTFNIVGFKHSLDLCTQNQKMVASVSIAFFLVGVQPL